MEKLVSLENVTKRYGALVAVNNLTMDIEEGEVFALLGPNGSGKTTTFLMMMGLTEPSSGRLRVCGYNPVTQAKDVKRQVAYLPDTLGFYDDMTAYQNLMYTAQLAGVRDNDVERIDALLQQVDLFEQRNKRVGQFSRGMKQRLGIADVLVKTPRLIILDEPTLGLDPQGARELLELVRMLSVRQGVSVLLSSHQLEHVEMVADRIAIFRQGSLMACGSMEELVHGMEENCNVKRTVVLDNNVGFLEFADRCDAILTVERHGMGFLVTCSGDNWQPALCAIMEAGFLPIEIAREDGGLSKVYHHYFAGGGDHL